MQYHYSAKPLCAALVAALAACASGSDEPSVDEVRAVAERRQDVNVAKAEGYTTDNKCVTAEMLGFPKDMGVMGLHYVRRDMLGRRRRPLLRAAAGSSRHRHPHRFPATSPRCWSTSRSLDGSLVLVAVENLVFASAWHHGLGNKEPPKFHGRPYELSRTSRRRMSTRLTAGAALRAPRVGAARQSQRNSFAVQPERHLPLLPAARRPGLGPRRPPPRATRSIRKGARELVRSGALSSTCASPGNGSGRLEGAINRPMSSFATQARALPKDRLIVLYRRSGCRSRMAADLLAAMGFTQVYEPAPSKPRCAPECPVAP